MKFSAIQFSEVSKHTLEGSPSPMNFMWTLNNELLMRETFDGLKLCFPEISDL